MRIYFTLNGDLVEWDVHPSETLLAALRSRGWFGVKSGGCAHGECGACTVLLDHKPFNSCTLLAAQVSGHQVETIEAMGQHPDQGWKKTEGLHPIQQALVESGAIQCGYCTPAFALAARALLDQNPNPTEDEVRAAISGVLCRCTGYLKPVQAILRAAAFMRGEVVPPIGETPESGMGIPLEVPLQLKCLPK